MTKSHTNLLPIIAIAFLLAIALVFVRFPLADASAPSGLPASIATTSNPTVTATAGTLVATSSCSARIISTSGSAVMLTFSDYAGQTPTGSFGHLQPASTTVSYDSGLYGCGLVKVYSYTTQLITVSETR